ncbi:hypothetical protein [Shimia sp. MMG029]|uniref:hypothetical protein n=1 Tax=Shimia sp. MMG029 TaxID=3021978 RepID=UPI0022FEAE96|nr:hypothetical protein [Shimia sp. MMG029]MDA5555416.1 hypothetical protein [Shimia sp. MMG029]
MKLFELVKANYATYPRSEIKAHIVRLAVSLLVAVLLAVFSSDASAAFPIMVTSITILTGFAFTALFSNHLLADVGLPKASNESDRQDLIRLERLAKNFKARSSYFIPLSIIEALLLIAAGLKFSSPQIVSDIALKIATLIGVTALQGFTQVVSIAPTVVAEVFLVLVMLVLFECLYTFYRLSETIVAVVEVRTEYLKASESKR